MALEKGDLYVVLPGTKRHGDLCHMKIGDTVSYVEDAGQISCPVACFDGKPLGFMKMVERHKCGALEFVCVSVPE